MKRPLFEVGTLIVATRSVGRVDKGLVGIVTGIEIEQFYFWKRPLYVCAFVGNIKAVMKPSDVVVFDRGSPA